MLCAISCVLAGSVHRPIMDSESMIAGWGSNQTLVSYTLAGFAELYRLSSISLKLPPLQFRRQLSQMIKPLCRAHFSVGLRRNPVRVPDRQAGPETDFFCGQHPDDGRRPSGGRRTRLHQLPRRQGHHRLCHGRSAQNRIRRRRLLVCESRRCCLQPVIFLYLWRGF